MSVNETCPVCRQNGAESRLRRFQINFEESMLLCEDPKCTYPLGLQSADTLIAKQKAETRNWQYGPKKLALQQGAQPVAETKSKVSDVPRDVQANVQVIPGGKQSAFQGYAVGQTCKKPDPSSSAVVISEEDTKLPHQNVNSSCSNRNSTSNGETSVTNGDSKPPIISFTSLNQAKCCLVSERQAVSGEALVKDDKKRLELVNIPADCPSVKLAIVSDLSKKSLCSAGLTTAKLLPIQTIQQTVTNAGNLPNTKKTVIVVKTTKQALAVKQMKLQDLKVAQSDPNFTNTFQNIVPDKLFLQWENSDALCWLDVVLCLLIQSKSVRKTISHTSPQCGRSRKGFLVRTLLEAYDQAMRLSRFIRSQKSNNPEVAKNSVHAETNRKTGGTQTDCVNQTPSSVSNPTVMQNGTNNLIKCSSKYLQPAATAKGVPLKMGAGQIQSCLLPSEASLAELMACDADFLKARAILSMVRELVFKELQPKLRCEKGRKDSPVFAIPLLLHSDPDISHLFKTMYKFETKCTECGNSRIERYTKVLPTLPKVAPDFSMQNVSHLRDCFTCKAPNQKRQLHFESLAQCVMIHFVEGLPSSDLASLDFSLAGQSFHVSAVVQYKCDPSHFVIWIKHPTADCWMECDDLKGPLCRFTDRRPTIPASQIHIVFWEKVDATATTTAWNCPQKVWNSPQAQSATRPTVHNSVIKLNPAKVIPERKVKEPDKPVKENFRKISLVSSTTAPQHNALDATSITAPQHNALDATKDEPKEKSAEKSVTETKKKKETEVKPVKELKPKTAMLRKTYSILKQMKKCTSPVKCSYVGESKKTGKIMIPPKSTTTSTQLKPLVGHQQTSVADGGTVSRNSVPTMVNAGKLKAVLSNSQPLASTVKRKFPGASGFEGYKSKKSLQETAKAESENVQKTVPSGKSVPQTTRRPQQSGISGVSLAKTDADIHKFSVPLTPSKRKKGAKVGLTLSTAEKLAVAEGHGKPTNSGVFPSGRCNNKNGANSSSPSLQASVEMPIAGVKNIQSLDNGSSVSEIQKVPSDMKGYQVLDDFDLAALGFGDTGQQNGTSADLVVPDLFASPHFADKLPGGDLAKGNNAPAKGSNCDSDTQAAVLRDLYQALDLNITSDVEKQNSLQTSVQLPDELFS